MTDFVRSISAETQRASSDLNSLGTAFWDSFTESFTQPITALAEPIDRITGSNLTASHQQRREPETDMTKGTYWASQVGNVCGMLPWLLAARKCIGQAMEAKMGVTAAELSGSAATRFNIVRGAATGFAFGTVLTPSGLDKDADFGQFVGQRLGNGLTSAATFALMDGCAMKLGGASKAVGDRIGAGFASGLIGGAADAELNALRSGNLAPSRDEFARSVTTYGLMGLGMSAAHERGPLKQAGLDFIDRLDLDSPRMTNPRPLLATVDGAVHTGPADAANTNGLGLFAHNSMVEPSFDGPSKPTPGRNDGRLVTAREEPIASKTHEQVTIERIKADPENLRISNDELDNPSKLRRIFEAVDPEKVKRVVLDLNRLDDAALLQFPRMPNVEHLDLSSNPNIHGSTIARLCEKMPNLKSLNLSNTSFNGRYIADLAGFRQLESLTLDGTGLRDSHMPEFAKLRSLRDLSICHNHVSDTGLAQMPPHDNLRSIRLVGDMPITDAAIPSLIQHPNLTDVRVGPTVSAEGRQRLSTALSSRSNAADSGQTGPTVETPRQTTSAPPSERSPASASPSEPNGARSDGEAPGSEPRNPTDQRGPEIVSDDTHGGSRRIEYADGTVEHQFPYGEHDLGGLIILDASVPGYDRIVRTPDGKIVATRDGYRSTRLPDGTIIDEDLRSRAGIKITSKPDGTIVRESTLGRTERTGSVTEDDDWNLVYSFADGSSMMRQPGGVWRSRSGR